MNIGTATKTATAITHTSSQLDSMLRDEIMPKSASEAVPRCPWCLCLRPLPQNECTFSIPLMPTNYAWTTTVVPLVDTTPPTASPTKVQRKVNIEMVGTAPGTFIFHLHSELEKTTLHLNHIPLILVSLCRPSTTTNQSTIPHSDLPRHRLRLLTILTATPCLHFRLCPSCLNYIRPW